MVLAFPDRCRRDNCEDVASTGDREEFAFYASHHVRRLRNNRRVTQPPLAPISTERSNTEGWWAHLTPRHSLSGQQALRELQLLQERGVARIAAQRLERTWPSQRCRGSHVSRSSSARSSHRNAWSLSPRHAYTHGDRGGRRLPVSGNQPVERLLRFPLLTERILSPSDAVPAAWSRRGCRRNVASASAALPASN